MNLTRKTRLVLLSTAFPFVLGACAGRGPLHHYFHQEEQPHAAEWGYEGDNGPSHWGDLSPEYAAAKDGREQSPIDIRAQRIADLPQIAFDYQPSRIRLVYNGHTVEEKEDKESSMTVDGVRYELAQFHFHSPSEHTIDGEHAPMEMHLVHKSADGEIAVVAVMIAEGAHNAAFEPVWNNLPRDVEPERTLEADIDAADLLPSDHHYYRYEGSFTTPPCTEDVLWMVLSTPVTLSAEQIATFRGVIEGNNRPVQPLNGREVVRSR